jgi:hypothetical protein
MPPWSELDEACGAVSADEIDAYGDALDDASAEAEPGRDDDEDPYPRRRRRAGTRARSISVKRGVRALRAAAAQEPVLDVERPRTRGDCAGGERPCLWVSCKHHLYLDVNPETGSVKLNFPDVEPEDMVASCALDVAERGGVTLEEVGEIMNLTRERIRQIEVRALFKLKAAGIMLDTEHRAIARRTPQTPEVKRRSDAFLGNVGSVRDFLRARADAWATVEEVMSGIGLRDGLGSRRAVVGSLSNLAARGEIERRYLRATSRRPGQPRQAYRLKNGGAG